MTPHMEDRIRELASRATPGPWDYEEPSCYDEDVPWSRCTAKRRHAQRAGGVRMSNGNPIIVSGDWDDTKAAHYQPHPTSCFIAACDPSLIRAAMDVVSAARALVGRERGWLEITGLDDPIDAKIAPLAETVAAFDDLDKEGEKP